MRFGDEFDNEPELNYELRMYINACYDVVRIGDSSSNPSSRICPIIEVEVEVSSKISVVIENTHSDQEVFELPIKISNDADFIFLV